MSDTAFGAVWRNEKLYIVALAAIPVIFITVFFLIPIGWILFLSFVGGDGQIGIAHYQKILATPSLLNSLKTTFVISITVSLLSAAIGYPIAYLLSRARPRAAALLLIFVLIPYWTSILVRTYAWLVLLQRKGLVNEMLLATGIVGEPLRMSHNMLGVIIGMTHIMVPFFVLPVYASMRQINPIVLRAAAALGASPIYRFWTVFVPLTAPGLAAGFFFVFVLCLGFYVTPAILGGGRTQMISQAIEASLSLYSDWGMASALGVVLLAMTAVCFIVAAVMRNLYRRIA